VFMYENVTMRPIKIILRSRGGGVKNDGGGESKIYCNIL
jgi:hypothetical protein